MFKEVLSKNAKESLALLGESGLFKDAYLAGGTALALQFGHRCSYDFDFFTPKKFDEKIFLQRLQTAVPDFRLERTNWGTVLGYIRDTRFSLFFYKYSLLFQTQSFFNINLAGAKDIAAMKIAAIADRGAKRDFIDLYFIAAVKNILNLEEILELYDKKFGTFKQNKAHILKSLVYFGDAESDKMPQMLEHIEWGTVRKFFEKEIKSLSKKLIN